MEEMQRMRGVTLTTTTLWERSDETARVGTEIFRHLVRLDANGQTCYFDDTRMRILSCDEEDGNKNQGATQTTEIIVKWGERKIVLIRKNSLFYKTPKGAGVGDILTSLIQTCRLNGVDAWDYLVTIIRNEAEALRSPERYLPWNYGETRMARAA